MKQKHYKIKTFAILGIFILSLIPMQSTANAYHKKENNNLIEKKEMPIYDGKDIDKPLNFDAKPIQQKKEKTNPSTKISSISKKENSKKSSNNMKYDKNGNPCCGGNGESYKKKHISDNCPECEAYYKSKKHKKSKTNITTNNTNNNPNNNTINETNHNEDEDVDVDDTYDKDAQYIVTDEDGNEYYDFPEDYDDYDDIEEDYEEDDYFDEDEDDDMDEEDEEDISIEEIEDEDFPTLMY